MKKMLQNLKNNFPWPAEKYDLLPNYSGWCCEDTKTFLEKISKNAKIIIELGSYLGKSTRHFLEKNKNCIVICVDNWKSKPSAKHMLEKNHEFLLYELFVSTNWDYKDRIIIVKNNTIDGLLSIRKIINNVDCIYIDASHDYNSVILDIKTSFNCFPKAKIFGHDWDWKSVSSAVKDYANKNNCIIKNNKSCWHLIPIKKIFL